MGKKSKKMKSDTKKCLITGISVFLVLGIAGGFLFYKTATKLKREYNQVNEEMATTIATSTRTVYRALTEIKKGQLITEDVVEMVPNALSSDGQELFMTVEDLGKEATVDIAAGQMILANMVTSSLTENWQEVEHDCIWLNTNLEQYDYVDIRILFPNGVDYVVAAKKCIRDLDLSINNVFFWLNEDELLALNAAIVDANRHNAKIYTTKYMKPAIQEAHVVTYQPTDDVIDLMKVDPNIVQESARKLSKDARAAMEEKLSAFKESIGKQMDKDELSGYDFELDTSAGAEPKAKGESVDEPVVDPYVGEESPGLESSRNIDASNQTTLEEDAALTQ